MLLDRALIWTSDEIGENMKVYANDFSEKKGRDREDVLLKFYNETAHAKTTAVWYVHKLGQLQNSPINSRTSNSVHLQCVR